jgi:urea carboxylase system permease
MSVINNIGVTCELVGVVLLCVALFSKAERGPGVVLDTGIAGSGSGYLGAFVVSGLMAAYVMVGFDSAGELSEETRNPRRTAPRTIVRALIVSGIGGAFMLLATLMAAPSLTDGALGDPSQGLPSVVLSRLGDGLGRAFLVIVAIAVLVCTLAIQTATTRMMFSMARDRVLPFSTALAKVNRRTGTPILPAVIVGVLAIGLLVLNVHNEAVFLALTSVCIMLLYIAYLMVTIPLLRRRLRGGWARGDGLFSLGRCGPVVNAAAVVWGIAMAVNLAWPRAEVFGSEWYLRFFPELVLAGALLVGAVAHAVQRAQLRRDAAELTSAPVAMEVAQ